MRRNVPGGGHGVFLADPATGDLLWWCFDSTGVPPPAPLRGRTVDGALVLGPHQEHRLWWDGERLRRTAPGLEGRYTRITVGH